MRKLSNILICGLLLISCNSNKSNVTVKKFTTMYFDSLTKKYPTAKFIIIDDSTIESKFNENDIRISVDNAYKEYQADPDSIQTILSRYIAATSEVFSPKEKINKDRIVPIIKPIGYLDDIKDVANNMGATKGIEVIYEKYNDQLLIVYAEDKKNSISYLTQDDIKSLSIKSDSIKKIAIYNLDKLLTNIERKGGDGIYMLTAGGDYEVSLILLPNILTKESLPVNGDFIIAIPNRDMLLITGSNDKAGIEKVKEIARNSFQTGTYQVSEYLFKWNGKKFEKYD